MGEGFQWTSARKASEEKANGLHKEAPSAEEAADEALKVLTARCLSFWGIFGGLWGLPLLRMTSDLAV